MGTIQTGAQGSSSTAHDGDLAPGQQVGEYIIEGKIGEGGFGAVFRATHPLIGKLAAVKVLARQYSADESMLSRFIAEARAVNQIRHRNIIDIFAFGQLDDGRHYYVMELLDGEPLDRFIAANGGCALATALPILREVARALDAAHAKGIAHRDLKPENIFLARDNDGNLYPKLLDFGIAKLLGTGPSVETKHKTRTGAPIGTPYYMSPEQCRGREVDHRTDIYSFGCLTYELLTGKVPFDAEEHISVMFQQISSEPTPPSELVELPRGVDEAIAWMMQKEPADRPPDLASALAAIEQAAGIEPERVRPSHRALTPIPRASSKPTPADLALGEAVTIAPNTVPPMPIAPRARRGLWIALACAAVVAAVSVGFVLASGDEARKPQPAPVAVAPPPPPPPPIVIEKPAPEPQFVTIRVDGAPAGTEVFGPSGPLGRVPGEIQLVQGDTELQLTFAADGYETATHRIRPAADAAITIEMKKKPRAVTRKKPPREKPKRKPAPGSAVVPDPYSRK